MDGDFIVNVAFYIRQKKMWKLLTRCVIVPPDIIIPDMRRNLDSLSTIATSELYIPDISHLNLYVLLRYHVSRIFTQSLNTSSTPQHVNKVLPVCRVSDQ